MATSGEPITIKKYANRRLYNTVKRTYVTLEDLAAMAKAGEEFIVHDNESGEDITRSVLAQIIREQETKHGQCLLPINFLRLLIRFYGNSLQMLVPHYLELSLETLMREQEKYRHSMAQAFGVGAFGTLEDQARRNMEMFERALAMFSSFARRETQSEADKTTAPGPATGRPSQQESDELRHQMENAQQRLSPLSEKDKS